MQCPFCEAYIPYYAPICHNCLNNTKCNVNTNTKLPPYDMYGLKITEVVPEEEKLSAREETVQSLYWVNENNVLKGKLKNNKNLIKEGPTLPSLAIVILCVMFIAVMNLVESKTIDLSICITLLCFIIVLFILSIIWFRKAKEKLKNENEKLRIKIDGLEIHKNKCSYYYSDRVFGFSILNTAETEVFEEYCFCEIDKRDIIDIHYDTLNSEYVLKMKNKTFMNYTLQPTNEFRIPDVFDDTRLSIALGLDLPSKYMNF